MLSESEIKAYTVDIPNDIQAAQRAFGCAPVIGSPTKRVKMTFRITEYHTFERDVDAEEFKYHHKFGDTASYLDDKFHDDPMPDSDICTESVEIDNWEVLSEND